MILVDTSVLIDALRRPDPWREKVFVEFRAAICGIVRAEVLAGARTAGDAQRLDEALASFPYVPFDESLWAMVGSNIALLRRAGVTAPFQDVAIATLAIAQDIELWTRDGHFPQLQTVLGRLRLLPEPTAFP